MCPEDEEWEMEVERDKERKEREIMYRARWGNLER